MTLPDPLDLVDIVVRTAVVYVAILVILRIAGKREVAQLSMLDFVTILLIANGVQNAMVGANVTVPGGIAAAITLVLLDRALGILRNASPRFRKAVEGEPRLLVRDGAMLRRALREEGVTEDELASAVRQHGLVRIDEVALAVLETNGAISVIAKADGTGGTRPAAHPDATLGDMTIGGGDRIGR